MAADPAPDGDTPAMLTGLSDLPADDSPAAVLALALRTPEDLSKLALLKARLLKEQALVDATLKSGVKAQFGGLRTALAQLAQARQTVLNVHDVCRSIDDAGRDPTQVVRDFPKIVQISRIHRHITQTQELADRLRAIPAVLADVSDRLAIDAADRLGPAHNLLVIHFKLSDLERLRNEARFLSLGANGTAPPSTPDVRRTLDGLFVHLDRVLLQFDAHLWSLVQSFVSLAEAGQSAVIVRVAKILQFESSLDEKAVAFKFLKKAQPSLAGQAKHLQHEARQIKHLHSKLHETTAATIKESFELRLASAQSHNQVQTFIDGLPDWIFSDLLQIQECVAPAFPSDVGIYASYVKAFHTSTDAIMNRLMATNPDPPVMLSIYSWVKTYTKELSNPAWNIDSAWISPPLLEGKETDILDRYVESLVGTGNELLHRAIATINAEFTRRTQQPNTDNASILFHIVNAQIDTAAASQQSAIVVRMLAEIAKTFKRITEEWISLAESEVQAFCSRPEDSPEGLDFYLIALANDQMQCSNATETLQGQIQQQIRSPKYQDSILEHTNLMIDAFLNVATKCTECLVKITEQALAPAWDNIFTPAWGSGADHQEILNVLGAIMADYVQACDPLITEMLIDDIIDYYLTSYLLGLRRATKIKTSTPMIMKDDMLAAVSFFEHYKAIDQLQASFDDMQIVLKMMRASKREFFLDYQPFATKHGPNLPFVEGLLKAREDFGRSDISEIMSIIKQKNEELQIGPPGVQTLVTKVMAMKKR